MGGLRRFLIVLTAAATILAVTAGSSYASRAPAGAGLSPLHATRGTNPGIFDAQGRQVLLRGVNFNELGDYFQADPSVSPVIPFRASQFDDIAAQGFDVVRLTLSWSLLEPKRGQISTAEINRIQKVVDDAAARHLYVVLDMHQDAWGKYIASPPGTVCPPGTQTAIGWDGAPKWATITDGLSTCRTAGIRELSPAVTRAFDNFYANVDGIQDQFIDVWAALAKRFANDPAVVGYDLLNEPHFSSNPATVNVNLANLYQRLDTKIRSVERSVGGGFSHIVFFEPDVLWSALGVTDVPSPTFTTDTNIVFAPHLYGGSLAAISVPDGYQAAEAKAATYGTTFWSGEWGAFNNTSQLAAVVAQIGQFQDATLTGGAWWQWEQSCGDPHTINGDGGTPPTEVIEYNIILCPGNRDAGPDPLWQPVLTRSYPRAAPGRLLSLVSDPTTGDLQLTGNGRGTL
ncbi:MAG: cellulase family glycosylhydrolase, partial [Acidimicrobiaceae bacterium]|nr:cellulase family glycosylhydrolase [Acidimicrobiaceae bacterium]